jgi:UDP:flavonoid glycosyltransferase YjiC (YdhE family)
MSRVAFLPLPEPGHILPTLRIARLLKAQGHEVFYFAPQECENFFRSCGIDCHPILKAILPQHGNEDLFATTFGDIAMNLVFTHLSATGKSLFDLLVPELSRDFDLLLCDALITLGHSTVLAKRLGRRVITINAPFNPEQFAPHESEGTEIVLCPRELGVLDESVVTAETDRILYGEPSICYERGNVEFPWKYLRRESELIYCSFGSQISRYGNACPVLKAIIEACSAIQAHDVVVVTGELMPLLQNVRVPGNVLLVRSAPQLNLLARAKLFITHGGLSGVKEGIIKGVPMLVIPFDLDQPANAERVEHHRLGLSCTPERASSHALRRLILELVGNTQVAEGLKRMQGIFLDREAKAPAAKFIADLL